ncbi:MAG: DUF2911 domain-containing protein [Salegentibacter sp.]
MHRGLKTALKIVGIAIALLVILVLIMKNNTKMHSPEDTVTFKKNALELEVFYNRPYKKDRKIFGDLVPYGKVWRTGANEATTFTTNEDILVDGSLLKAGKYTLWTIPQENSWKVIFNSKMYPWGINFDEEAYRNPKFDVLVLEQKVRPLDENIEQFTISFKEANDLILMRLEWEKTEIDVPIKRKEASPDTSS